MTALLSMSLLNFLTGCSKKESPAPPASKFSELSTEDKTRLDKQRALISEESKKRYGTAALTKTKADLAVLQRLLDDHAFAKTQTYELQCLGVALGDVLASEQPLRWVMVTDEYGTDPTLRFKDTTIQVNALTLISKRVERNESVDVGWLFDKSKESTIETEKELQK